MGVFDDPRVLSDRAIFGAGASVIVLEALLKGGYELSLEKRGLMTGYARRLLALTDPVAPAAEFAGATEIAQAGAQMSVISHPDSTGL